MLSKQRRWQLAKQAKGLCVQCGKRKLKTKAHCKECAKRSSEGNVRRVRDGKIRNHR